MKAPSKTTTQQTLIRHLVQAERIVVTSHARPDGDALGAAMALGAMLRAPGKTVQVALDRDEIGTSAVLEGVEDLTPTRHVSPDRDLLVAIDCGSVDRMPQALQPFCAKVFTINIDHHPTNTLFGDLNWVNPKMSSCGEMIWRLSKRAGWSLNHMIAEALWVAIATDTGRFAYENTTSATLRCAADLLKHGVRTAWLNDQIYGQFDLRVMRLRQRAYNSLESWADGEATFVYLATEDFEATGCQGSDAEDIIEIPRAVKGSRLALFLYETPQPEAGLRLSIRTRPPLDATDLALHYGGGGHNRAAGCNLPGTLRQARRQLRTQVEQWLRKTAI